VAIGEPIFPLKNQLLEGRVRFATVPLLPALDATVLLNRTRGA